MTTRVVLDTDIGTDVDDTWALVQTLRTPALDLRLVTTVAGNTAYRARAAAALLAAAGRPDIPVATGIGGAGRPDEPQPSLAAASPTDEFADGIDALVAACAEPVTIVAIGPLTNVAAALARDPAIADRARLVAMAGSVHLGHRGGPGPVAEYNAATDVAATRAVLRAPWDVLLTPLDTCGTVFLDGDRYQRVCGSRHDPLIDALLASYREWLDHVGRPDLFDRRSTTLYDCVAVHLAHDESLWEIEDVPLAIGDDGVMRIDDGEPAVRVALRWRDRDAFLDQLAVTLAGTAG
ncbi:MAG TPA: nucleoside hydrolase [Acidimicrobiales bacterium]|nr:nucleoside hydrolase [Acidimicrobiales bacterium]